MRRSASSSMNRWTSAESRSSSRGFGSTVIRATPPSPVTTDEETFKRVFGDCQWAVMAIVAQDDSTYARLSFNIGPGGQILVPTEVDFSRDFGASDHSAWDAEYEVDVRATSGSTRTALANEKPAATSPDGWSARRCAMSSRSSSAWTPSSAN